MWHAAGPFPRHAVENRPEQDRPTLGGRILDRVILIDAQGISMQRPGRPLFDDASVTVSTGDRIGIVGLNGCGKSTMLSVLAGTREPEGGVIRRGRDVSVSMLDQDPDFDDVTVREAVSGTGGTAAWSGARRSSRP